jgi:hypothetical protein
MAEVYIKKLTKRSKDGSSMGNYVSLTRYICLLKEKAVSNTKYLRFGSIRRAAADTGTDVTQEVGPRRARPQEI